MSCSLYKVLIYRTVGLFRNTIWFCTPTKRLMEKFSGNVVYCEQIERIGSFSWNYQKFCTPLKCWGSSVVTKDAGTVPSHLTESPASLRRIQVCPISPCSKQPLRLYVCAVKLWRHRSDAFLPMNSNHRLRRFSLISEITQRSLTTKIY